MHTHIFHGKWAHRHVQAANQVKMGKYFINIMRLCACMSRGWEGEEKQMLVLPNTDEAGSSSKLQEKSLIAL